MKQIFYCSIALGLLSCGAEEKEWDATGSFEATEVLVSAEANGRILELNMEEGDRLQTGDCLGVIDTMQLFLKKQQLLAGMKAMDIRRPDIQKQIATFQQQLQTAQTELARAENLVKANAGNQKAVDDWASQISFLEKQIEAQRSSLSKTVGSTSAEVESVQYQIMQIDDQLQKSRIVNPRTGTVLTKYAEAGEMVSPGKFLYKIADTDLMFLRVYITADMLETTKLGQKVQVHTDQGNTYEGTITWVSAKSEFTPKGVLTKDERANLVYAVKIAVKNDGSLKIGQYGEMELL